MLCEDGYNRDSGPLLMLDSSSLHVCSDGVNLVKRHPWIEVEDMREEGKV